MKIINNLVAGLAAVVLMGGGAQGLRAETTPDGSGGSDARAMTGHYWFDSQTTMHPFTPGHFEADAGALPGGLHTISAIVEQGGILSATSSRWFIKTLDFKGATVVTKVYVDGKPFNTTTTASGEAALIHLDLDVNSIPEGLHYVYAIITSGNTCSALSSAWFIKTFNIEKGQFTANVYVDGNLLDSRKIEGNGTGMFHIDADLENLPIGFHSLKANLISSAGVASDFKESYFMRVPTAGQMNSLKGYYLIDGKMRGETAVTKTGTGYHLNPDLTDVPSGLHNITAYLSGNDGITTPPLTSWFFKVPMGGQGVKSYTYWLNNDSTTMRHTSLAEVADPLSIVTLLDMPQQEFCSARYTFALEKEKPVVYARNNFNMMFADPESKIAQRSESFTDVRVRMEVSEVAQLDANTRTNVKGLEENTIRWYGFNGLMGDSIGVKLDRGAMFELYDPDGNQILSGKGVDAVTYRTHTLTKNGTYYLGVHDITATYGKNEVNIDFRQIARFAILSMTPETTAAEGLLGVTVVGNGFSTLKSIKLASAATGAEIEPTEIEVADNYNAFLIFNLSTAKLPEGDYNLVATFDDKEEGGTKTVTSFKTIKVEPAQEAEVEVTIETPQIALTTQKVYFDVTNKSNVGTWGIPVNIAIKDCEDSCRIDFIDFGFSVNPEQKDSAEVIYKTDNLLGTGEQGFFIPCIIPYLAPHETLRLTIGVTTSMTSITMYGWTGEPWSEEAKRMLAPGYDFKQILEEGQSNFLTLHDVAFEMYSVLKDNLSAETMSAIEGIVKSTIAMIQTGLNLYGQGARNVLSHYLGTDQVMVETTGFEAAASSDSIVTTTSNRVVSADKVLALADNIIFIGLANSSVNKDMTPHFINLHNSRNKLKHKSSVNPDPKPTPTVIIIWRSWDPNDLTGYESASGSTFIGTSVKTVTYTIGFENDPEIANASASRIVVTNTIDGKTLDRSSLKPTKLIIGDREIDLPGEHHFVKTLDMRTDINAIAELTFDYEPTTGVAEWKIRSLDPMTMEETTYAEDGVLPVNNDSNRGQGYLVYTIDLASGLSDGTEIDNQATIVFDDNDPIDTPVWTNVTDYVLPKAEITDVKTADNLTFNFTVDGEDSGSGIWYYDLYVKKPGSDTWTVALTQIESNEFSYTAESVLEGAEWAIVATDRAGNVQSAAFMGGVPGDADGNGSVDANDVVVIRNYFMGKTSAINTVNADVTLDGTIDAQDAITTRNIFLGKK